jgi:DNA-binding transcriptional regulator PaaX
VHISGSALDYNELKLPVLQILFKVGSADSKQLSKELAGWRGITIDIHALRMALMRYYKQGLLKRERRGGMFSYALSERGVQRLRWLEMSSSQTQESQPQ